MLNLLRKFMKKESNNSYNKLDELEYYLSGLLEGVRLLKKQLKTKSSSCVNKTCQSLEENIDKFFTLVFKRSYKKPKL